MPTYVHLHRQALSSWVFEDARRWHLFCYLLMKADQQGRAEVSVKEYAETFGIPRTTCRRIIDEMKELAKKEVRAVNPIVFQPEEKALYRKVEKQYGQQVASEVLQKLWKIVARGKEAMSDDLSY